MVQSVPIPTSCSPTSKAASRCAPAGRLRIYFGASAGVGKDVRDVSVARALRNEGKDVLVGVLERMASRKRKRWLQTCRSVPARPRFSVPEPTGCEFDLDKALVRRPALILVDRASRTLTCRVRHPKRWQDIDELQARRIRRLHHVECATPRQPERRRQAASPASASSRRFVTFSLRYRLTKSCWWSVLGRRSPRRAQGGQGVSAPTRSSVPPTISSARALDWRCGELALRPHCGSRRDRCQGMLRQVRIERVWKNRSVAPCAASALSPAARTSCEAAARLATQLASNGPPSMSRRPTCKRLPAQRPRRRDSADAAQERRFRFSQTAR